MNAFLLKTKYRKHLFVAITFLLCLIIGAVIFNLNTLSSVALEQNVRCGIEEHIHTDECYDGDFLICEKIAHSHDENCYIVLLNDNDINNVLTIADESRNNSLENVISNVMSSALNYNSNINKEIDVVNVDEATDESVGFSKSTLEELNRTISANDSIPDIVLNESLNSYQTNNLETTTESVDSVTPLINENIVTQQGTGVATLSVGDEPSKNNYDANFYVYIDNNWTCIGTLPFTTSQSGWSYNCSIPTSNIINLVNDSLGTNYNYNSFDIAVATSLNGSYIRYNLDSTTTNIGSSRNINQARAVKYIKLIPNNGSSSSTAFAFYTVKYVYPDGSSVTEYIRSGTEITLPSGEYQWSDSINTYASRESVTITSAKVFTAQPLGPVTYVSINYNVNFPTVSGVTVDTSPTIAGTSVTSIIDGFTENSSVVIRNVSSQSVEGKVNGNTVGLSRVIQFRGWQIGNTDIILQPNVTLVWDELLQYATGASINLKAVWEYNPLQTASFYIRYDSIAVDSGGNVTDQDSDLYTPELYSAYVGGVDTSLSTDTLNRNYSITDDTAEISFNADKEIRELYGEKTDGVWLNSFPSDDYIFENLKQYAETGYLSVDGETVKAEDLNDKAYAIRWYVFKSQSDAWHIDGRLIKKEGLIHVYKTFAGNKELITQAKEGFYIDAVDVTDNTSTILDLTNYTTYDSATETYMWEIENVKYGEYWEITEHPNTLEGQDVEFTVYSEYIVLDAIGDQSVQGNGTSLTVRGVTYAVDEGVDEVLRASFINIYNKSNSIVIKKEDSRTGNSIGGATFRLLQNGVPLKFIYNDTTKSYQYDPVNGTQTILSGTSNGYFEIAIEDFSYDLGNIVVQEVSPPEGYSVVGDIQIGYIDDSKTIGIISGNTATNRYSGGVLIVGNSTDITSVTARKKWECPENEWQDVTVQLLANDKLVSTVISGVEHQVVLNSENNWSYTWNDLPVYINGTKINWTVKEIKIGNEQCKVDGTFVNWLSSYEIPIYSTDSYGNQNVLITITNTTKRVMLRLTKTDISKQLQLKGAEFLLQPVDAQGNPITNEISKTGTTSDAGTLIFDNLKCGVRYCLKETTAPAGYLRIEENMYFVIHEDGSVMVEDSYYVQAGNTAYNIVVKNPESVYLPETGDIGISMFYAFGTLLLASFAGYIIYTFSKRRCKH